MACLRTRCANEPLLSSSLLCGKIVSPKGSAEDSQEDGSTAFSSRRIVAWEPKSTGLMAVPVERECDRGRIVDFDAADVGKQTRSRLQSVEPHAYGGRWHEAKR
jgi:hypothetical protein